MLQSERQDKIKELIKERRNLKISEISEIFQVSEMTVHRDIKPLVNEGVIMKTFGGITLVREIPGNPESNNECILCNSQINPRFVYKIILPENRIEDTCCALCGLVRQFQLGESVIQALCFDFLTGTTVSSFLAWYVFESSIRVGCCKPQILTFERKDYAEKFVSSFGGKVMNFQEAIEKICK
ncbi:DeoR family transcriptional regulator [Bacillus sp. MM2020_1]|nr:DeoR family transcriptional regulator [Bacillus sp. MM2020_1]